MPHYGEVHREGVFLLTRHSEVRIPPPPTMRNHGNVVMSAAELGRFLAERAEEGGAYAPPRDGRASGCSSPTAACTASAPATRDVVETARSSATSSPARTSPRRSTVLAEGTQGHLTGAALEHFGLEGRFPQVWALGVKEVWKVARPLDRIMHTMGWPLRKGARFGEFGGSFIYPMGEDMVSIGFVAGLETRDVEFSVHDVLQEFKTHRFVRGLLEGGERIAWGAKTITEGGYNALPSSFHAPGLLLVGRERRARQRAHAEGHPLRDRVREAGGRGRLRRAAARREPGARRRAGFLRRGAAVELRDHRPVRGAEYAAGRSTRASSSAARSRSAMTVSKGHFPPKEYASEPNAAHRLVRAGRSRTYPAPDGRLIFDKLSSVFLSGNRTRDDQPNHIRVQRRVPRELAEMWSSMCPAHVYEVGAADGDGNVTVEMNPSNCVQCGAISAKGGRLTPPEGGSGPEYTLT